MLQTVLHYINLLTVKRDIFVLLDAIAT